MKSILIGAAGALALAATANAQQISTIATETFDYPAGDLDQQQGDFGWFQQWFAFDGGVGASTAVVVSPGLDATGGAAETSVNNAGAFRSPKTGPWVQTVADGFNFGGGNGQVYVSFTAQRAPGSDAQYGGLSLHTSFVGEKIFIGSPFQTNEWGIGDPGFGSSATVPGSSVDTPTRIVVLVDYQTGDERLRMWLDPATANPTTNPDLDLIVSDHDWNEIRLQSGESATGGSFGYIFDDIVIECVDCTGDGLLSDTTSISTFFGGTANLDVFGGVENEGDFYIVVGSFAGTSPGTPFGVLGVVPLNFDAYTNLTLANGAAGGLTNGFGNLDGDGRADVDLNIPMGQTNLAGLTASYVAVVIDAATFTPSIATNAVSIQLLP